MEYDVIVAGAGPAGSTSARECASRGLSVLLLDKAVFPRDKPCGGGVNVRAARLLPFDLDSVTERTISALSVSVQQSNPYTRRVDHPLSYLTQRRYLDAFLMERAQRSGVKVKEGAAVRGVEVSKGSIEVRAGSERFRARSLIAADGANGPTAKLAGLPVSRWKAIALEANVTPPKNFSPEWVSTLAVDVGAVAGGYGWLFPKGEHVNVGLGGRHTNGPSLRRMLDGLTRFYGLDPTSFWGFQGHPLPVSQPGAILARGPVLAVGDAAGLLDPLTGEGIYAAIASAITAARHIARFVGQEVTTLNGYQEEMERGLLAELRVAIQMHDLFHLAPWVWAKLLRRSDRMWNAVCGLITGEQTYLDIKRPFTLLDVAIDIGSEAIRRAGANRR
jgi:geranylgeranyl reductase family protein